MEKPLLIFLIILFILSIIINIGFIKLYDNYIFPDEKRIKDFTTQLNAFQMPYRDLFDYEKRFIIKDSLNNDLEMFYSAFHNLSILREELITVSGGYNAETGVPMNVSSQYVNRFFYEENNVRPFAIEFLKETLNRYVKDTSVSIDNTNLERAISYYLKVKEVPIFHALTIPEALVILDEMMWLVYLDRLNYVASNYDCLPIP